MWHVRATGAAAKIMQAARQRPGPAKVACVVARAAQGRGYAKEAARSLVAVL